MKLFTAVFLSALVAALFGIMVGYRLGKPPAPFPHIVPNPALVKLV